MMTGLETQLRMTVLGVALGMLMALPAASADVFDRVEDAYAARSLRRTLFEPAATSHLDPDESRFLERLFAITDEATLLNANVARWLMADGRRGLHAMDYLDRADALRARLDALETPDRIRSVRDLIGESLLLQRQFVKDWYEAMQAGRAFESQLTDEYAYHEGLHRSHRVLLKAFAELYGLFPDAGETNRKAFHDHLRAVDWK